MKDIVTIHERALKNGRTALYLQYNINGERKYKSLKMFLHPGKDQKTRLINKTTMEAAEVLCAKEIISLRTKGAGLCLEKKKKLIDYYDEVIEPEKGYDAAAKKHWIKAFGENVLIGSITDETLQQFVNYLYKNGVRESTANVYLNRINYVLNRAVENDIIAKNPIVKIPRAKMPKAKNRERDFLVTEEIKALINTPCEAGIVKKAFLFSCFTGLRFSDILNLKWTMIQNDTIIMTMKKTKSQVVVPLSENAKRFLPTRKEARVFADMTTNNVYVNSFIKTWVKKAGIEKHITFHNARHSFATLLLTNGVDIYTVSKLLGHNNVGTTQVYAKLVDEKKVEAVNKIPII